MTQKGTSKGIKEAEKMGSKPRSLVDSKVLVIYPNGPHSLGFMLKPFLKKHRRAKSASFTYIGHPVPPRRSLFRESECLLAVGKETPKQIILPRLGYFGLPSLLLDWVITLVFLAGVRRRHDVCITTGLHLWLMSIILKKLGVVKQAVMVFEEYRSQVYKLTFLRRVYRSIASWCCERADLIVYTSPHIGEALVNDGIKVAPLRQMLVPLPLDLSDFGFRLREELLPDSVVWIGQLTDDYGFELVIDAMELVVQKKPNVIVNVMSYTTLPNHLREKIREKGLEKHFRLLGFIKDEETFRDALRQYRVALALYRPADTTKKHADVARPWTYMSNGVPHIINRLPAVATKIEEAGAGIVIDYDRQQLADAIITLLTDDQLHEHYRQRGLELAESRASGPIFRSLFDKLGMSIDGESEFVSNRDTG